MWEPGESPKGNRYVAASPGGVRRVLLSTHPSQLLLSDAFTFEDSASLFSLLFHQGPLLLDVLPQTCITARHVSSWLRSTVPQWRWRWHSGRPVWWFPVRRAGPSGSSSSRPHRDTGSFWNRYCCSQASYTCLLFSSTHLTSPATSNVTLPKFGALYPTDLLCNTRSVGIVCVYERIVYVLLSESDVFNVPLFTQMISEGFTHQLAAKCVSHTATKIRHKCNCIFLCVRLCHPRTQPFFVSSFIVLRFPPEVCGKEAILLFMKQCFHNIWRCPRRHKTIIESGVIFISWKDHKIFTSQKSWEIRQNHGGPVLHNCRMKN